MTNEQILILFLQQNVQYLRCIADNIARILYREGNTQILLQNAYDPYDSERDKWRTLCGHFNLQGYIDLQILHDQLRIHIKT